MVFSHPKTFCNNYPFVRSGFSGRFWRRRRLRLFVRYFFLFSLALRKITQANRTLTRPPHTFVWSVQFFFLFLPLLPPFFLQFAPRSLRPCVLLVLAVCPVCVFRPRVSFLDFLDWALEAGSRLFFKFVAYWFSDLTVPLNLNFHGSICIRFHALTQFSGGLRRRISRWFVCLQLEALETH